MAPKLFTLFGGHVVRSSCYQNQNSPYRMGAGFCKSFKDISSEMIHALLPLFMAGTLGASAIWIGLVEGIGEGTALIAKVFSGVVADRFGHKSAWFLPGTFWVLSRNRSCFGR